MSRYYVAVGLGTMLVAVTAVCASCKNTNQDVPSAPSAAPTPSPAPSVDLVPTGDDAGADADAGDAADAKKVATGPYDPTRMMACCNALAQNAKSAPITQQPMMLAAAAACKSAVQSGNMNSAASALKGAGMTCK